MDFVWHGKKYYALCHLLYDFYYVQCLLNIKALVHQYRLFRHPLQALFVNRLTACLWQWLCFRVITICHAQPALVLDTDTVSGPLW